MKGQTVVAETILNRLSESGFHKRLYPEDSDVSRDNRMTYLLDLYLNTPDKGVS